MDLIDRVAHRLKLRDLRLLETVVRSKSRPTRWREGRWRHGARSCGKFDVTLSQSLLRSDWLARRTS